MPKFMVAFFVSCFIITGCSPTSEEQPVLDTIDDAKPVSFHHYFSGSLGGGIDDLINIYNETQDTYNIKVVPIDHEAYKTNILESFNHNSPADLNSYWAGAKTESVIEYLTPLDDVFDENNINELFQPSLLQSSSIYNDQYYLLPITQHYVCFFYSKSVFEQLNLEEPKNWNDFIGICEKLKANDITPIGLGAKDRWPAQFWFDYLLLRTAGNNYRNKLMAGSANYTDEEVKQVMILWRDMIDRGYFMDEASELGWDLDIVAPMMNDEVGMTLMGTWLISIMENNGYDDDYGVFSFPLMDEGIKVTALGPVDGVVLPKDALNIEGAKDAIVHFADEGSQRMMALGSGGFAPNINVDKTIYSDLQLKLLEDMDNSPNWTFNYDLATEPAIADLGLDFFVEFLEFPDAYDYLLAELDSKIDNR